MAKDGSRASSRPPQARSSQKVDSPPVLKTPLPRGRPRKQARYLAPDLELYAAAEASQLEFQRVFGVNLKVARLQANLKQSEIAVLTGLTQQYLSLIEAGQQNVTIKTMALLAKVVDHDLLHLLKEALEASAKKQ